MRRLLLATLFAAGAAAFVAPVGHVAAQAPAKKAPAKGKDADKEKMEKDEAKASGATVEVSERKDGRFQFTVKDAAGKSLGGSGFNSYTTRDDAVKAIDKLKAALADAKVVDKAEKK